MYVKNLKYNIIIAIFVLHSLKLTFLFFVCLCLNNFVSTRVIAHLDVHVSPPRTPWELV